MKKLRTIEDFFVERIKEVDSIFDSYGTLYGIYGGLLKQGTNADAAYKSMKKSADTKQKEISDMLYKQGFVIMVGAAESLLKDVFKSLLIEDFAKVIKSSNINFSAGEVQEILVKCEESGLDSPKHVAAQFGRHMYSKLQSTKDPERKINFQNVKQMEGIFDAYFGINIDNDDLLNRIHRHWQVRHLIAHNDSVIDDNFVNNVKKVQLLEAGERVGKRVSVIKRDYIQARNDFIDLFTILTNAIQLNNLDSKYVKLIKLDS
ncbi:MAG: hypothetical protein UY35_C0014G0016 [Candidatus Saccharibacteria bacterium GW2011_GWC2_48_9]|nr:MAG: hypothetical protein UY35_C0014G0016 [Candidatus Saccharibacteria bacterium GW2011_GWC2_48_9]HCH33928.1 hypothetical protein [Candidatus Saccharibacteria bacterium]